MSVKDVAKQKGAGTDAIIDLVGFREENVLSVAAFYTRCERYAYMCMRVCMCACMCVSVRPSAFCV